MNISRALRRLTGKKKPAHALPRSAAVPASVRGTAPRMVPPPPPPPPVAASAVAPAPVERPVSRPSAEAPPIERSAQPRAARAEAPRPQIRLGMADGTVRSLPIDPELEKRAEYLVRSMLPPTPPPDSAP